MVKNGFLHCHTMFSLFDSAVTPDELVKRAKELGAENITLTDHGTLLGIEPFMDAGAKYKINTIPGVELYLKHREHFILFAKNYKGYQAISKTMRNADYQPAKKSKKNKDSEEGSQRYYACVPDDVLLQLKGNENIVATTACMQGPIAKILLYNFRIRKKINKIENNIPTNEIIIEKEEPEEIVYENVKSEDVKLIESSWQKIRQKIKEDKVNKQMPVYFLLGDVSGFNVYNNNLYIIYGHGFEFAKKRLSSPETISYIEQMIRETINRSFSIKIILESEVKNIELEIKNEKVDKGEEILKSIVKDDILEIRDNEEKQD